MRGFAWIDRKLLAIIDGAVLLAWNRMQLPRAKLVRATFVTYVVGWVTLQVADSRQMAWTLLWLIVSLPVGAIEEFYSSKLTARQNNARVLARRQHPAWVALRFLALTFPLKIYDEFAVLDALTMVAGMSFFLLTHSLTPEGPPKRRTRTRAVPASFEGAHGRV